MSTMAATTIRANEAFIYSVQRALYDLIGEHAQEVYVPRISLNGIIEHMQRCPYCECLDLIHDAIDSLET